MFLQNVHRAIPLTTFQRGKIMNAMHAAFNKAQNEKAKRDAGKEHHQTSPEFVSAEEFGKFRNEILEILKRNNAHQAEEAPAKQEAPKQEGTAQEPPKSQEASSPDTAEDASIKEAAVPSAQEEGKKKLKGKTILKVVAGSAALVAVTLGGMTFMKRKADKALDEAAKAFIEQNPM